MASVISSIQKCKVNRMRVYNWNEIVHNADQGEDVMVLIIKNNFTLNDFPKKLEIPDRAAHLSLKNFLAYYGFSEDSAGMMIDFGTELNYPITLFPKLDRMVSRPIWKDMTVFDQNDLFYPSFGCKVAESFQDTLGTYSKSICLQISERLMKNYPYFNGGPNKRHVIIVEIYRSISINVNLPNFIYEYSGFSLPDVDRNCRLGKVRLRRGISLRSCLPTNPYERIPSEFHDPYYRLGKHTIYNQFRRFVTEPDPSIDRFCANEGQELIWNTLGFMRARMYTLYAPENTESVLQFLRDRNEGLFSASYPYKVVSPTEPSGFVEILSRLPNPVIEIDTTCPICLCRMNPDFDSVFETLCPKKTHIFHTKCWCRWYDQSFSCPNCRDRQ